MDTITNIRISAYCAASVAFDQKQNIYDGLKPLVKTAIVELAKEGERHKYMFNELRNKINSLFPVNINSAMLNKLLSSLKKDGTNCRIFLRDFAHTYGRRADSQRLKKFRRRYVI